LILLIGTNNGLIFYDGELKTVAKGNHYGITWNEKELFVRYDLGTIHVLSKDFHLHRKIENNFEKYGFIKHKEKTEYIYTLK